MANKTTTKLKNAKRLINKAYKEMSIAGEEWARTSGGYVPPPIPKILDALEFAFFSLTWEGGVRTR